MMANERWSREKELSLEDWGSYRIMSRAAGQAHHYLEASRRAGDDGRRDLERVALWHAVIAERGCTEALSPQHFFQLWPPGVSVDTRYGLQAAMRMVQAALPFTNEERQRLAEPLEALFLHPPWEVESGDLAAHEPELVEHWHKWLWADEFGLSHTHGELLGPSAVLDRGYQELAAHLNDILEDPQSEPL
jgi:hypothetical protein